MGQYAEGDMPVGQQIEASMESRKLRPSLQVASFQYTAFTKNSKENGKRNRILKSFSSTKPWEPNSIKTRTTLTQAFAASQSFKL